MGVGVERQNISISRSWRAIAFHTSQLGTGRPGEVNKRPAQPLSSFSFLFLCPCLPHPPPLPLPVEPCSYFFWHGCSRNNSDRRHVFLWQITHTQEPQSKMNSPASISHPALAMEKAPEGDTKQVILLNPIFLSVWFREEQKILHILVRANNN